MVRDELKLTPEHRPHDGRKHFVTAAKKTNVDEYAIKYMVGLQDIGHHRKDLCPGEFEWLKTELGKIK